MVILRGMVGGGGGVEIVVGDGGLCFDEVARGGMG